MEWKKFPRPLKGKLAMKGEHNEFESYVFKIEGNSYFYAKVPESKKFGKISRFVQQISQTPIKIFIKVNSLVICWERIEMFLFSFLWVFLILSARNK